MQLTAGEKRAVMTGLMSMFRHMVMGCVVIALDLMVFWVFDILHYHAQTEIVARGKGLLIHSMLALLLAYIT